MVNRDPEEARESHTWCHLVRAPAYPPWLQAPHRTNRTYFLLSLFSIEFVESRYYWIFSTQTSKVFWLETCYQKKFSCDNWSANTVIIKQWESVTIQIFIRRGIKITALRLINRQVSVFRSEILPIIPRFLSKQSNLAKKLIGMEGRDGPQGNQGVHMRNFKYACALMIQNIMNMWSYIWELMVSKALTLGPPSL